VSGSLPQALHGSATESRSQRHSTGGLSPAEEFACRHVSAGLTSTQGHIQGRSVAGIRARDTTAQM